MDPKLKGRSWLRLLQFFEEEKNFELYNWGYGFIKEHLDGTKSSF